MARLRKKYIEPYVIKMRLFAVKNLAIDDDTVIYVVSSAVIRGDREKRFAVVDPTKSYYYFPVTGFFYDKVWDWSIALLSSYIQVSADPGGVRVGQVVIAEYSTKEPKEDWDNDYGVFVQWAGVLQESTIAPSEQRTAIIPMQRDEYFFTQFDKELTQKIDPANSLLLCVLAYQNSTIDLTVAAADISLIFTGTPKG